MFPFHDLVNILFFALLCVCSQIHHSYELFQSPRVWYVPLKNISLTASNSLHGLSVRMPVWLYVCVTLYLHSRRKLED